MAALADGSVWASSMRHGLTLWTSSGSYYLKDTSVDAEGRASALERDPKDGSLWVGFASGGLIRLRSDGVLVYGPSHLGSGYGGVTDIQSVVKDGQRQILVGFAAGRVGIYSGD
jgi:hypothetical protein